MDFDRKTLDQLYQYCMVLCGNRDAAYDLLHQSIEKYLKQSPAEVKSPMAYIRRVARNGFFDECRRNRIVPFESLPDPDIHPHTEQSLESAVVDQITLDQVWRELQPAEREVLYFWAVQGMSATEIGLHLEQPRSSVLSRLRRVRERLQKDYPRADSGRDHE